MASALDIIGGVASVADPVLGWLSNKETNTANREINERNIAANKELQESQFKYNAEMYDRALADSDLRNDPLYQRNSYERAGLNPYMMMSNGASRQEISQATGSGSSAPSSIPMQAYQPNFSGIISAFSNMFANQKLKAETEGINIDNDTRHQKNLLDLLEKRTQIEDMRKNGKLSRAQAKRQLSLLDNQIDVAQATTKARISQTKADANFAQFQADRAEYENFMNMLRAPLEYELLESKVRLSKKEERRMDQVIHQMGQELQNMVYSGYLTMEQAKQIAQNIRISTPDEIRAGQETKDYSHPVDKKVQHFLDRMSRFWNRLLPTIPIKIR